MKKLVFIIALALGTLVANAQTSWNVNNAHSKLGFNITHFKITSIDGFFQNYDGSLITTQDDFDGATVSFSVDAKSGKTNNDERDAHLQQEEYFNAVKYSRIEFRGAILKKVSGKKYKLNGNLTIKGITKPEVFDVTYNGTTKDAKGNAKANFKYSGTIKRTDYNVGPSGTFMLGEEVDLAGDMELIRVAK